MIIVLVEAAKNIKSVVGYIKIIKLENGILILLSYRKGSLK